MATPVIALRPSVGPTTPPFEAFTSDPAFTGAPAPVAGQAILYYDQPTGKLRLSNNGGAFADIATGGSASPWNNTTTVGSITENTLTDTVLIGTLAAVAGRKVVVLETGINHGIRVENAAVADNVLSYFKTGDAEILSLSGESLSIFNSGADVAPRALVQGSGTATFRLGDGTGVSDVSLTRITGPVRLNVDQGAQFGGDLNRFESAWVIKTTRTAAGAGDNLTVQASTAVATVANTAFAGGAAAFLAGDAAANLVAQADGQSASIAAGNGASGVGGGAADGGNVFVATGNAGANGGNPGKILLQSKGSAGVQTIPPVTNQGEIGTDTFRFLRVRGSTIVAGDTVGLLSLNAPAVAGQGPFVNWVSGTVPALSAASNARMYFDSVSNTLKVSYNGGAYADLATGASSPWTRTGTVVALNAATTTVNPLADNGTTFGTQALRWLSFAAGPVGYQVFTAVGPNAAAILNQGNVLFGTGGASAPDVGLQRSAAGVFDITNGGAGSGVVNPHADNAGTLGTSAKRWANIVTGPSGYSVFAVAAAANPTSLLGSAILSFGAGGATAPDIAISRSAVNTFAIGNAAGGGPGSIVPLVDVGTTPGSSIGSAALRWEKFVGGPRGYNVLGASGDLAAQATLGSQGAGTDGGFVLFGPGGAAPADCQIKRLTVAGNIFIAFDDGTSGARTLIPVVDNTGALGTTANRWANVDSTGTGHRVFQTAGDTNAASRLGSTNAGGFVVFGDGLNGAPDARLQRTATKTITIDDNAGGDADLVPAVDHASNVGAKVGTAALRFAQVNAFEVNTGDVCFTDAGCAVCGQPFEVGDELVMKVIKIHNEPTGRRTRTVPAHHGCK